MKLAIVGGGLSGLAAAYYARGKAEVTLFESSDRVGGIIQTRRQDGYLLEMGPEAILRSKPEGLELCRELGLDSQVIPTSGRGGAQVVKDDHLYPIPDGFRLLAPTRVLPFLMSPVMSLAGKLRMALDLILPPSLMEDPSLAEFVTARLGREAYERLAQPLLGGIYGADPERLSLESTQPEFLELQRRHGSLLRGLWRSRPAVRGDAGARYSLFFSFAGGTQALIDRLAQQVGPVVRLGTEVQSLKRLDRGWELTLAGEEEPRAFDGVILATPAHIQAGLLGKPDRRLAELLRSIPYSHSVTVNLVYDRRQLRRKLRGFGFVVPRIENSYLLACTYSSQKWAGRAPAGKVLLRGYLGGMLGEAVMEWSDEEAIQTVHRELAFFLGIDGEPELSLVGRLPDAMPAYCVGHAQVIEQVAQRLKRSPTLALAGNGLYGIGIPDCIRTARQAVERVTGNFSD